METPLGINLDLAAERAFHTPLSHSPLLPLLLLSLASQKNSPDVSYKIKKEYDYIVVGGGTAGSVVAARLSEVPCVSVLLLEAGPQPPKLTDVPALNFWFSDIDWNYITAPQKRTGRGLINRQLTWPSGKALGGSTVLSAGHHVVGNKKDYDNWAYMGAKGWSYKEVFPYFKKLENNKDHHYVANGYHGVGGPVTVMRTKYESKLKTAVNRAAREMGYKILDSNNGRQTGFYDPQAHLRNSQRCSTAKAYLVPAENRKNLDILAKAFVKKIIINKRRANGVLFEVEGKSFRIRAKREVILSAGAINSPQILMLSGIGPKEELHKFNIPVQADLPVGKNLQDHAGTAVDFTVSPYIRAYSERLDEPESIKRYIHNRTGPLASTVGITNMAFLRDDEIHPKKDWPNYELHFLEGPFISDPEQRNIKPEVYKQVYSPYENHSRMTCIVNHLRPKSRGRVTLRSPNPYDPPVIDPNYLEDPRDLRDIVEGMKACKRIGTSQVMKKSIGAELLQTLYPGCEKYVHDDDAYYACQARTIIFTFSHACGTAKMGDPKDPTTVVDPKLRVKNIRGLRVVDASIMPTITSGNTAAPAIMIGEKASDIIKQSIKCHHHESDYSDDVYDIHQVDPSSSYPSNTENDEYDGDYDEEIPSPHEDDYEEEDEEYSYHDRPDSYDDEYDENKYVSPSEEPLYDSDSDEDYGVTDSYPTRTRFEETYREAKKDKIPSWMSSVFQEHKTEQNIPYYNPLDSDIVGIRKPTKRNWGSEIINTMRQNPFGRFQGL